MSECFPGNYENGENTCLACSIVILLIIKLGDPYCSWTYPVAIPNSLIYKDKVYTVDFTGVELSKFIFNYHNYK